MNTINTLIANINSVIKSTPLLDNLGYGYFAHDSFKQALIELDTGDSIAFNYDASLSEIKQTLLTFA